MEKYYWIKRNVKIPNYLYRFSRRLFRLYRNKTGTALEERLRLWLYAGGIVRLSAEDYLELVKVFDVCSDGRKLCADCPDLDKAYCAEIFAIIVERSKYVYKEETGGKSSTPVHSVCGPAKKYL